MSVTIIQGVLSRILGKVKLFHSLRAVCSGSENRKRREIGMDLVCKQRYRMTISTDKYFYISLLKWVQFISSLVISF